MGWLSRLLGPIAKNNVITMSQLKTIAQLVKILDDKDPLKKILNEIHQTLEWYYEWFQKIEEAISKED